MSRSLVSVLAEKSGVAERIVENLVGFYDEGATIPFVSRYRKDQTGNLDEVAVADMYQGIRYFRELFARREFILEEIGKKGKLTDELREKIERCLDAKKLEDLYLPYKEKKKTKAEKAREAGLEPLALLLLGERNAGEPLVRAREFLHAEKGYGTPAEVLEGARAIVAQHIIESTSLMETYLAKAFQGGRLTANRRKGYQGDDQRFEDYYEYSEPLGRLREKRSSHRFLAAARGADREILTVKAEVDDEENVRLLQRVFITPRHFYRAFLEEAAAHAYEGYLRPALETRILGELRESAESEAFNVFTGNLEALLMAPPLPYTNVLALDPGLRSGVKAAVLDRDGTFLGNDVLYIHTPQGLAESARKLEKLVRAFSIGAVSIGNGTGSRETLDFVRRMLKSIDGGGMITVAVVSESGASVYSASEAAREEFPELDVTVRGAISIGRRLQNPLAELVKVDPKALGVGQYQHDVDQKKLMERLEKVVESCVNRVGVDVNTASSSILTYVSGIGEKVARSIVEHRRAAGFFKERRELKKVKGLGPKTFEQCAGFLMIRDGKNPLDATRAHPESYGIVEKMAKDCGVPAKALPGNVDALERLDPLRYLTGTYGEHNVRALVADLMAPGQDPRREFRNIAYRDGVEKLEDVKEGMTLEGRVTNVTNFGAFIDVGVHQDGLCHVSQMANRFVRDPRDVVSVGDIVQVQVLNVDYGKKRLSLKLSQAGPAHRDTGGER